MCLACTVVEGPGDQTRNNEHFVVGSNGRGGEAEDLDHGEARVMGGGGEEIDCAGKVPGRRDVRDGHCVVM